MNTRRRNRATIWKLAAAGLALAPTPATGQTTSERETIEQAEPSPGPLAGPEVEDAGAGLTGGFLMDAPSAAELTIPPEVMVLGGIDLDDETRARIDAMLEARALELDAIVRDNRRTVLTAIMGARNAEPQERRENLREVVRLLRPVLEDGPLGRQIAAMLPEDRRAAYTDELAVYHRAAIEARRERARPGDDPADGSARRRGAPERGAPEGRADHVLFDDDAGEAQRRERDRELLRRRWNRAGRGDAAGLFGSIRVELRASLERVVEAPIEDFNERIDRISAEIGLSPAQSAELRALLLELGKARGERGRAADLRGRLRELLAGLSPEQREKVRETLGLRGARDGARPRRFQPGRPRRP